MKRTAYVVVNSEGNGYTKRHGDKRVPSVYDYRRNAVNFINRNGKEDLKVVKCVITYSV